MSTYENFSERVACSVLRRFTYNFPPYAQWWVFGVTAVSGAAQERVAAARGLLPSQGCAWLVMLSSAHEGNVNEWLISTTDREACREDEQGISLRFGDGPDPSTRRHLEIEFRSNEGDAAHLDGISIMQQPLRSIRPPQQTQVSPLGLIMNSPLPIA